MRTIVIVLLLLAVSTSAEAGRQNRYVGIHPVPKGHGGGVCHIEAPHVHVYAANKLEYRDYHGAHYFIGDPTPYGWDGPRHAYKGHHPIHVEATVGGDGETLEFCYLNGPHYHYFTPPEGPEFKMAGNAYFYVAEPPEVYLEERPALIEVNAVYTPLVYTRPVVEVEAPAGWIGIRAGYAIVAPAAVVVEPPPPPRVIAPAARVRVGAEVRVPMPSLSVNVGVGVGVRGGVGVGHKHKKSKRRGR
ncbi:MAG: hypothetical protein AB7O24_25785 [Kofleriaceae bacterium]